MTRSHFLLTLTLALGFGSMLLGSVPASAQSDDFGSGKITSGYFLSAADSYILGNAMDFAVVYYNGARTAVTAEHPRTAQFDFTLRRIDVALQQAPKWQAHRDGRLGVSETPDGVVEWFEIPAEMLTVPAGKKLGESFDLLDTFGIAAIESGRYELMLSWGEGASAETSTWQFELVVESSGKSADYLRTLAEEGSPAEKTWAREKLAKGGLR